MTWARLDDQFPDHPKVRAVGVFGLAIQTASICYSSRYLTDGFLSWSVAESIIASVLAPFTLPDGEIVTPAIMAGTVLRDASNFRWKRVMIASGLWEKTRGGVRVHDYLKYNPTRASVLEERAKTAQRVAKHRSSGNAVTNASGNALVRPPRPPNYKDKDVDSKPKDRPHTPDGLIALRETHRSKAHDPVDPGVVKAELTAMLERVKAKITDPPPEPAP